jgi:hypothetical protein
MSGHGLEPGFDGAGIGAPVLSAAPVDWRPKRGTITHMPDRLIANNPDAYLSPGALLNRLKSEFSYVEADGEEGRRHVLETIKRLKADYSPRHVDLRMVEQLERVKNRALFVCFGDDAGSDLAILGTYVIPGLPLVFEYASVAHEHAVRDLLARCAAALGYALVKDRRTIHDPGYGGTERRGFRRERRRFTERRLSPTDRRSL